MRSTSFMPKQDSIDSSHKALKENLRNSKDSKDLKKTPPLLRIKELRDARVVGCRPKKESVLPKV